MRSVFLIPFKDLPIKGEKMVFVFWKSSSSYAGQLFYIIKEVFRPQNSDEQTMLNNVLSAVGDRSEGSIFQLCFTPLENITENSENPHMWVRFSTTNSREGEVFQNMLPLPKPTETLDKILFKFLYSDKITVLCTKKIVLLEKNNGALRDEDIPRDLTGFELRILNSLVHNNIFIYTFPTEKDGFLNPISNFSVIDIGISNTSVIDTTTNHGIEYVFKLVKKLIANKLSDTQQVKKDFPGLSDKLIETLKSGNYQITRGIENVGQSTICYGRGAGSYENHPLLLFSYETKMFSEQKKDTQLLPVIAIKREFNGAVVGLAIFSNVKTYLSWYDKVREMLLPKGEQAITSCMSGIQIISHKSGLNTYAPMFMTNPEQGFVLGNFPYSDMIK